MPSPDSGKQCPALSPTKRTPSSTAERRRCGSQLPWYRTASSRTRRASATVGFFALAAGVACAHADARLGTGGHPPSVTAAHERALDRDVESVARGAVRGGVHFEPSAQRRVRRLVMRLREHAPPTERIDDEGSVKVAAVGADRVLRAAAGEAVHLRHLKARVAALRPKPVAERSVVERRPAPRQAVANRAVRGGDGHRRDLLAYARGDTHGVEPWRRRCARGRRALANVVAV